MRLVKRLHLRGYDEPRHPVGRALQRPTYEVGQEVHSYGYDEPRHPVGRSVQRPTYEVGQDVQAHGYDEPRPLRSISRSIPCLPQKRLYSQDLDLQSEHEQHFRSLEFANSHQKSHHLNQSHAGGARGAQMSNRRFASSGSLFWIFVLLVEIQGKRIQISEGQRPFAIGWADSRLSPLYFMSPKNGAEGILWRLYITDDCTCLTYNDVHAAGGGKGRCALCQTLST